MHRAKAQRRKENQGPLFSALSRETDFVLSAKLTIFDFDFLCAFASWRENIGFGFMVLYNHRGLFQRYG
jgi:hypothetical protein